MSCYPTNTSLSIDQTFENIINRNYNGYTFKETVKNHLIKMENSIKESIEFCNDKIRESEDVDYWTAVLDKVKCVIPEPHDCNIDYEIIK